jgi:hypothetical protein
MSRAKADAVTAACCYKEFIVISRGNTQTSELCFYLLNELRVPRQVIKLAEPAFFALEWIGRSSQLCSALEKTVSVWEVSPEL